MLIKNLIQRFIVLFLLFFPLFSMALPIESPDKIKTLANAFLEKNITLQTDETMQVNISLADIPQLAACTKDIEINFPRETSADRVTSLELTCSGNTSWHVFIPVSVDKFTKVVVAKHVIAANEIISETDLDFAQANINQLYSGYYKNTKDLVGQISSQMINQGMVISKNNARRPQLVHRNEEIDLIARKNAIVVTMKGVAKTDGCLHDTIVAYNPSSKKTMQAVVVDYNKAEVM